MKKQLKFWLAAFLMFCGAGQALAAEKTVKFDFSNKDQITTNTASKVVWTVETSTFVLEKGTNSISTNLNSPLRIFSGNVGSISAGEDLYFKQVVVYGNIKNGPGSTNPNWTNAVAVIDGNVATLTPSGDNVATITFSASSKVWLDSIVCTLSSACTAPAEALAIAPAAVSLEVGESLKVTAKGGNGAAVAYASSDEAVVSVSADGLIKALQKGTATISATQAKEGEYCSQSVEVPVTVTESYTVTWQTPTGSTTSKVEKGAAIGAAYPAGEVATCNAEDYAHFAGWITENVGKEGSVEVTFVSASTVPAADVTYYAAFADEAKVKGDDFACEGSLSSLTNNGGSYQKCESYSSGSYAIKMATDGACITVPVANPETVTFKYNRRGGAVTASVELQYALDNANFTTLETWNVSGATTTNVTILTNSKPFPQGTINVRFLYKRSSGNIAVGPISVTAGTDFPAATVFVTACCDAWTAVPTVNVDKTTLDADAAETLSASVAGQMPGYAGTLAYSSSNPLVATVDAATGVATARSAGAFRVIATWSGDAAYCDNSAESDEITVTGKVLLSYDKNSADATGDMPTQKFDVNAQVTLATCQFERTGYHFVGWAEKADGAKLWNDGDEVILTGNKQLYAVWEINVYNVEKGEEENGKFTLSAATVEHGGRIVVTKTPAANYKNGTVSVVPADAATVDNDTVKDIKGDITINVAFEEKTKYAMTWHSGTATATTWVYEGDALGALPEAESSCDAANHPNFYGWCATEYGSHSAPKTEAPTLIDASLKPTGDADFYAVYSNFVMGGGEIMTTLAVGDQVLMVADAAMELSGISDKNIGTAVKYDGAPNGVYPLNVVAGASANSFAFEHDGKYLSYHGNDNALYGTDAVDNASSWTVSFDGDNAAIVNVSSSSRQIYYNKANPRFACYGSAQMPIQLVRAGRPTEWMTSCCTLMPFEVRDTTLLLEDAVDAMSTVDVAILVSGDGNGGEKAYRLAENYDGVTLSGSTFASSHVGNFTAVVSQETQGDVCGNEYEIVITVEPKNSTINFEANADDVTGAMEPMNAETLTKQTLTPNAFAKIGYHFVEWNTQADGSGTAFADGAEVEMHGMILYAQWEINKYQITLDRTGEGDVTLPAEVQHGGSFEVVATPAVGHKLVGITVAPAENATLDGNTVQNVVGDITVSVTFEALAQFKVVYRDAENAEILSETVYEGSFANPDLSQFGCGRMPLAGFSNTQVADNSETFEAVDVKTAVIDRDTTFWAVYALYKGAARRFNPATTQSGDFTIYADVDGAAQFAAGSLSSGKYASTENADEANIYTFEQVSAGVYTIKRGEKYVNYKSSADLEEKEAMSKTWTISQGEKGSWRVADTATPARALLFNNGTAKFGGYAVSNIGTVGYFDVEIGNSVTPRYFSTLDCSTLDVTGVNLAALDTVCVGETKTLVAEVLPENATDKSVVWSSGNPAVATVDAVTGEVKGLSQGIAVITVTTNDEGYTASCQLFVRQPVVEISLQETSLNLKECEAGQLLHATVLPDDATNKLVRWSSNDESVATVDALGFVQPVAPGNAVITATTVDGGFTAECAVTVAECVKVTSLTLDTAALEFKVCENKNYLLKATVLPENAENKALLWESSDPRVAVVVAGLVTPVSAGTATISATTTDGTGLEATCAVTVTDCEDALENVAALDGVFVRDGRIVVEQGSLADVRIYNALGQTVALQTDVMAFELSVPQGVYVVVVGDKSQKVVVK